MTEALFIGFGLLLVASSLMMILHRNPVTSALFLVVAFCSLAGIYLLLHAEFLGMVQIIVYAGAIVVLFLFVVMLLNLRHDEFPPSRLRLAKFLGTLLLVFLLSEALRLFGSLPEPPTPPEGFGGYRQVGIALYTDYVLLVEVASLLLTAAIVGALILAKRTID